jgi:polygalacturonase
MNIRNFLFISIILAAFTNAKDCQALDFTLTGNQKAIEVKTFTHYHYSTFDLSGKTELTLTAGSPVQSCEISPRSRGISYQVKITGYGTINGNGAQLRGKFGDDARMRLIMAVNSKNLTIDGVMLQDPGSWNTQILRCQDVVIRHVKLMNNTELSNTDGFDPDASKRVLIEDCFAYCSDDNVAIKTTNYGDYIDDVDDITVRGCVFLTKKSSLKVGTETRAQRMHNILFEDNDVLESDRGMALYVSDGAIFDNIRYLNNRFERNYPDAKCAGFYFQINKRNKESKPGQIKNILVRDCVFYTTFPKPSEILGLDAEHLVENITIDNLIIEGKKVTSLGEARIKTNEFTQNVTFK